MHWLAKRVMDSCTLNVDDPSEPWPLQLELFRRGHYLPPPNRHCWNAPVPPPPLSIAAIASVLTCDT
jgi:hypothetical protein